MKDLKINFYQNSQGCVTPCPNGINATVGSTFCIDCIFYRGINKLQTIIYCKFNRMKKEDL